MVDVRAPTPATGANRTSATSASRPAEESDGQHTGIDKEDLERHRRGKQRMPENRKPLDIYEDLSEVSIALLRGFLQGLLETQDRVTQQTTRGPVAPYAMQAYQSAMKTAPDAPPPPTVSEETEIAGFTRLDLAAAGLDRGALLDLMDELARLEKAGIAFIAIEKSTSFLQSIRDGIARLVHENLENPA